MVPAEGRANQPERSAAPPLGGANVPAKEIPTASKHIIKDR